MGKSKKQNMYKENLYKLIREEEVIIWAGSGLSLYAGYPSGEELKEIILNNLTPSERNAINCSQSLTDIAEDFYRIKKHSKNALIKILNQTFVNKKPASTVLHDKLSTIPHFKTIITTNYDTLLEDSFKQKSQIAFLSKHIPYLEKDKTHIFKVHGDLKEPDSIIITQSDYNNFFKNNNENGVYWTVIKERLSTKNVLFLVYNLEDPNVSIIFDRITDNLGSNRKECFFVAPNLSQHKIDDLTIKKIHYINMTAEELINESINELNEHIIEDLENGKTSANTFQKFLSNINLSSNLKTDNESFKLKSLHSTDKNASGKFSLKLKNNPKFITEFNDYIQGKKTGDFEITQDNLIDLDIWYGGLKFPKGGEFYKIEFKRSPNISMNIDVKFESGFELNDIPIKLYLSSSIIEVHLSFKNADIKLSIDITKLPDAHFNLNYKHNELCKNTKEEIELHTFLNKLGKSENFVVYTSDGKSFTKSLPQLLPIIEESEFYLEYFNLLKTIEDFYKVRFSNININNINKDTFSKVDKIIKVINGESIVYKWNKELTMELIEYTESTINQLKLINEVNVPIVLNHNIEESIELHGHNLTLGYKRVEFTDPYITNLQAIIEKKDVTIRIKSKTKKMIMSYTKTNKIK